ncbi:TWiK family of potassium channels protein 7 [Hetaerina americana]|uniref:TWiK family of potassium channels protein 7 n=1 Tax=Hetaerina americana TaxID=62018 RepID=UPI003A7F5E72
MERPRARRRRGAGEGWRRVKDCLRQFVAFMFSNVGIVGLVVGYAIAGAFIFMAIEGGAAGAGAAGAGATAVTTARGRVVRRLWDATSALNVFSEAEWRALAAAEVAALQRAVVNAALENGLDASPPPRRLVLDDDDGGGDADASEEGEEMAVSTQWSFSGAFLYSLTVITTIGYGNVAPQTEWGKLATILYAIAGMPLFLLYLSNIGDILAKSFKWTYAQCCLCRWCNSSTTSPSVVKKTRRRAHRRRRRHRSTRRRPSRTSLRRRASVWSHEVAARGGTAMAVGGGAAGVWPGADSWPPEEDMMDGDGGETEDEDSEDDSEDDSSEDDDSEDDDEDTDGLEGVDGVGGREGPVAVVGGSVGGVGSGAVGSGGGSRSGTAAAAVTTESVTVPVSLCLAIMVGYVCGGALLFAKWEDWDFLDGSYFCFISLSTIGFGDIVPGDRITSGNGVELSFIFCSAYLMLGMALIAMCFSLMQEEVVHKMRGLMRAVKAMGRCLCGGRRRGGGPGGGGTRNAVGEVVGDIPLEQRMGMR